MLGKSIEDPDSVEVDILKTEGLGILDMKTILAKEKITRQVKGEILVDHGSCEGLKGLAIRGYEIHMGRSTGKKEGNSLMIIDDEKSGVVYKNVIGTYVHGIFENMDFTRGLLNNIRKKKGLPILESDLILDEYKEAEFNRLAAIVRESIDIKKIYDIINKN